MVIGFLFSNLTQWNHSYWLPLNAIVLLQPMYEESNYRLKTRFIGTVAGSIGVYILLSIFPGINAHFIMRQSWLPVCIQQHQVVGCRRCFQPVLP